MAHLEGSKRRGSVEAMLRGSCGCRYGDKRIRGGRYGYERTCRSRCNQEIASCEHSGRPMANYCVREHRDARCADIGFSQIRCYTIMVQLCALTKRRVLSLTTPNLAYSGFRSPGRSITCACRMRSERTLYRPIVRSARTIGFVLTPSVLQRRHAIGCGQRVQGARPHSLKPPPSAATCREVTARRCASEKNEKSAAHAYVDGGHRLREGRPARLRSLCHASNTSGYTCAVTRWYAQSRLGSPLRARRG